MFKAILTTVDGLQTEVSLPDECKKSQSICRPILILRRDVRNEDKLITKREGDRVYRLDYEDLEGVRHYSENFEDKD